MSDREREYAFKEASLLASMDGYFNARPNLTDDAAARRLFEAGFDRGYMAGMENSARVPRINPKNL